MAEISRGTGEPAAGLPQRLCSEIQLFDLCELDSCRFKNGRMCTDPGLIERFETIAEEDVRTPVRGIDEEDQDEEGDEFYESDESEADAFDGDEDDEWQ